KTKLKDWENKSIILKDLNNNLKILNIQLNDFNENLIKLKENEINMPIKNQLENEIESLNDSFKILKNDNEYYVKYSEYKKLQDDIAKELKKIDEHLSEIISKKTRLGSDKEAFQEYTKKLKELDEIKFDNNVKIADKYLLEEYLKIFDINNGIPSIIFKSKIPLLENAINEILDKYTNFKISIDYEKTLKNTNKDICIYQLKKNGEKITIASCSGYEKFFLNMSFKIG